MAKYIIELERIQKATTKVEVEADSPWKAKEIALNIAHEADFSTYDSDYSLVGNPVYVRPENYVNKFTPYLDKMNSILTELGYEFHTDDHEDEPEHFSKGKYVKDNRRVKVEIYLSGDGDDKGSIKLTPTYPVYDFDHSADPRELHLRLNMVPRTYKTRLTEFISQFEKAHATACAAQKELAEAVERAAKISERINGELGTNNYMPVKIEARRWAGKIGYTVHSGGISDPEKHAKLTKILTEEGIV